MTCGCTSSLSETEVIYLTKGQTDILSYTVLDETTKLAVNLTGAKLWFTVRKRIEDVSPLIRKRNVTAGGADAEMLIATPATDGTFTLMLASADTADLPAGDYQFDLWIEYPGPPISRKPYIERGILRIKPAITTEF